MASHDESTGSPFLVIVLTLIALIGGSIALGVQTEDDDDADVDAVEVETEAPAEWDERVLEYVAFVEAERGLEFEHPIEVAFLAEEEFRARVTRQEEPTPEERSELDQLAGVFRALGIAEGDLDLLAAFDQLVGESVIGIYDPETDSIAIRGDEVTPEMRPTLVHELTHALQAQHYELEPDLADSGEELGFRVLVESDAIRIQREYIGSLSGSEQRAIYESEIDAAEDVDLEGVPEVLTELFATPYALGPPWLDALIREEGDAAVDAAFDDPPVSEEQILLPERYFDRDEVVDVEDPELASGEEAFGEPGDFGMLSLLLVLGERLPYEEAWTAAEGWEGDAMVTYRADERDCLRVAFVMESEDDGDELAGALERWTGDRDARVDLDGATVELTACDPGTAATRPQVEGPRAFEILALRVNLIAGIRQSGSPLDIATCAADEVMEVIGVERLFERFEEGIPDEAAITELQQAMLSAMSSCR